MRNKNCNRQIVRIAGARRIKDWAYLRRDLLVSYSVTKAFVMTESPKFQG